MKLDISSGNWLNIQNYCTMSAAQCGLCWVAQFVNPASAPLLRTEEPDLSSIEVDTIAWGLIKSESRIHYNASVLAKILGLGGLEAGGMGPGSEHSGTTQLHGNGFNAHLPQRRHREATQFFKFN